MRSNSLGEAQTSQTIVNSQSEYESGVSSTYGGVAVLKDNCEVYHEPEGNCELDRELEDNRELDRELVDHCELSRELVHKATAVTNSSDS